MLRYWLIWMLPAVLAIVAVVARLHRRVKPRHAARPAPEAQVQPKTDAEQAALFAAQPSHNPRLSRRGHQPWRWVGPGETVHVAGYAIPGGLLYVGHGLGAVQTPAAEPALIDPGLAVDRRQPDHSGAYMGYWPAYHQLRPVCRSAYLAWLAGERRDPQASIGYVFLFFYGLERRALADAHCTPGERASIGAEVRRLLTLYAHNRSFRGYAMALLSALDFNAFLADSDLPALAEQPGGGVSAALRAAIGRLASERGALPGELAFAWVWSDEALRLRTPARRCPSAFQQLFLHLYRQHYGPGIELSPTSALLSERYRAASPGLPRPVDLTAGQRLSDITVMLETRALLADLALAATSQLDTYSRIIGRRDTGAHSLAAAAALPLALFDAQDYPDLAPLKRLLAHTLDGRTHAVLGLDTMLAALGGAGHAPLGDEPVRTLAALLQRLGVGVSPDPRLTGLKLKAADAVVVFVLADPGTEPGAHYRRASLLLRLASRVCDLTHAPLLDRWLDDGARFSASERARLAAERLWFATHRPGLYGLRAQIHALTPDQRRGIAGALIALAGAQGEPSPGTIEALQSLCQRLSYDPSEVIEHLYAITRTERRAPAETPAAAPLDETAVARKLAETERAATLLATLFADEASAETQQHAENPPGTAALDEAHAALLARLGTRARWQREALETLAAECGLMLDGALETINECAFEHCDGPCIDEDEDGAYLLDRTVYEALTA